MEREPENIEVHPLTKKFMYYILSILFPLGIVFITYVICGYPKSFFNHIKVFVKALPYIYCYTLFLYFLQMEDIFYSGWTFVAIIFFLIPISIILYLIYFGMSLSKKAHKNKSER